MLRVICLNQILKKAHAEVIAAHRKRHHWEHLSWGTSSNPQLSNNVCSSDRKWGIKCLCNDDESAALLKLKSGFNLVVASAGLILNWLQKATDHLNSEDKFTKWEIHHIYKDCKMNQLVKKLSCDNQSLLEHVPDEENNLWHQFEQSQTIVIIIKQFYRHHITEVMQDIVYSLKPLKKWKVFSPVIIYWNIAWGRVAANEAHTEVSMNAMTIHMFKTFNSEMRKWFLTDTPFESFSVQMQAWISFIETLYWINPTHSSWSEKHMHQRRLKNCTASMLCDMRKTHKHIIDGNELNICVKKEYIKTLTQMLKTLWLKCSATQFTFYSHSLTDVSLNMHQNIDCSLQNRFVDLVNALIAIISSDLKNELQDKLQTWQNNNCLKIKSTLNLNNWLQRVWRLQVLSMFSMLKILKDTKNLTLLKIEDRQKDWICNQSSHLYNLVPCDSSYKIHVAEICSNCNFIKIAAINNLLQVKWDLSKKTVFCTMRLTVALIVYWVSHYIRSLIH